MNADYSMKRRQGDISNFFTKKKISRQSADDQQSVRGVKLNAAKQLTQANISRARPALMDRQVKTQVLGKCFKTCNVVFCMILQLFSE